MLDLGKILNYVTNDLDQLIIVCNQCVTSPAISLKTAVLQLSECEQVRKLLEFLAFTDHAKRCLSLGPHKTSKTLSY